MKKKLLYALSVLLFSFLLLIIMVKISPLSIVSTATQTTASVSDDYKDRLDEIYDVNFTMLRAPAGNIVTFLPVIDFIDYDEALDISEIFGVSGDYREDDEGYYFHNGGESLSVYKYGNRIEYEAATETVPDLKRSGKRQAWKEITDKEAAAACVEFIKSKFPEFIYEEVEINFDGDKYEITFINRLASLRDYAFPTVATVSKYGEIQSVGYSFANCQKLVGTKIKSMTEAYLELPVDFDDDLTVDLKKCTLVYRYQNSVIQPAYMFEGEASGGKSFKCFVNASVYNY